MVAMGIAENNRSSSINAVTYHSRRWFAVSCVVVLVFILWHIRNWMDVEDAVVYFSYFNNNSNVRLPFYYAGYISLYSQIASYFASYFAFSLQPFFYMIFASIIGVYFFYQLVTFTDDILKTPVISVILAFGFVALMVKTHGTFNLFVNLTYNIWIGWLGLYLRVLNGLRGRQAGIATIVLGVLSAWSHSFSVVLIPPLLGALVLPLAHGRIDAARRDPRILMEFGVYFVAAVLFPVLMIEPGFPKPLDIPDMRGRLLTMLLNVHSNTALTVVVGLLLVVIALRPAMRSLAALFRRAPIHRDDYLVLVMAFVGFGTVAIIFASGRVFIADKIWARYLFTPLVSLFLATLVVMSHRAWFRSGIAGLEGRLQAILAHPRGRLASGMAIVTVLAVTSIVPWHSFRQYIVQTIDTERFLAAAETYRATCQDGAFIRSWNKWSLAVLCHRRDLPKDTEAVSLTDDHVTVWDGSGQSRTADHAKPEVPMLFQPLDLMKVPGRP